MLDLTEAHFWEPICPVDPVALASWSGQPLRWIVQAYPEKPQRLLDPPAELAGPLIREALAHLPLIAVARCTVLSRMQPGQSHGMHADYQPGGWLTRVHVPLLTNPAAWLEFEDRPGRFHLAAGRAYTFNALRRHAFGNDGPAARTHLIFDVFVS